MESVAAGDHVAVEAMLFAVVLEKSVRLVTLEAVHAHLVHVEVQRQPFFDSRGDQVLDDLGLAVDDDVPSTRQVTHRHVVPFAVELEMDTAVHDRLSVQALRDLGAFEQLDGSLLEHPARTRASTYSRLRFSSTTDSMPARCNRAARMSPAGPAPMIAT